MHGVVPEVRNGGVVAEALAVGLIRMALQPVIAEKWTVDDDVGGAGSRQ